MFIIQQDNKGYFEQDSFGWSWQQDKRMAYKFYTKESAQKIIELLDVSGCEIVEVEK